MKCLYVFYVREFVMLCVFIFIFMVMIYEGIVFYNRKIVYLKIIILKWRIDKWVGVLYGDGDL